MSFLATDLYGTDSADSFVVSSPGGVTVLTSDSVVSTSEPVIMSPTSSAVIGSTIMSPTSSAMVSPFGPAVLSSPLSPLSVVAPITVSTNTFSDNPVVSSVNLTYSTPLIGHYSNLNADPRVHEQLVNYYYFKTLDKWLYGSMVDLLNYLKVNGDKVTVVSYQKRAVEDDSKHDLRMKVKYIEKHHLTDGMVKIVLAELVHEKNINWYDLPNREHKVIKAIKKALEKKLQGK